MTRKLVLAIVLILAIGALTAGIAIAGGGGGGDDNESGPEEKSLTGSFAKKAGDAALRSTGGGTVLEVERDDGNAAYEVEIRKPDGSVAEVMLDRNYRVTQTVTGDDD